MGTIILTMKSKRLAHWRTVSMEGGRFRVNRLSFASLRSWVLVKVGPRTLPTLLPRPSNAWRTRARNRCLWPGSTSGCPRLAATIRQAATSGFGWNASAGNSRPAENLYQGLQCRVFKVVGFGRACFKATCFCTTR